MHDVVDKAKAEQEMLLSSASTLLLINVLFLHLINGEKCLV